MIHKLKVSLDILPEDVGCSDYHGYEITDINVHEDKKEIWSVDYKYIWDCGDGCCSDTSFATADVGQLAPWLKKWILEQMPGYHFEG